MFDYDEGQYKTPNWSLTAQELRSYKGYENVSDEEAERVIAISGNCLQYQMTRIGIAAYSFLIN